MTKQQRLQRRLDMMIACIMVYHPNKLSQTQVGELFGISHQAVSKTLARIDRGEPEVMRMAITLGWFKPQPLVPKKVRVRERADTVSDYRNLPYTTPSRHEAETPAYGRLSQAVADFNRTTRRRRHNGRT